LYEAEGTGSHTYRQRYVLKSC